MSVLLNANSWARRLIVWKRATVTATAGNASRVFTKARRLVMARSPKGRWTTSTRTTAGVATSAIGRAAAVEVEAVAVAGVIVVVSSASASALVAGEVATEVEEVEEVEVGVVVRSRDVVAGGRPRRDVSGERAWLGTRSAERAVDRKARKCSRRSGNVSGWRPYSHLGDEHKLKEHGRETRNVITTTTTTTLLMYKKVTSKHHSSLQWA